MLAKSGFINLKPDFLIPHALRNIALICPLITHATKALAMADAIALLLRERKIAHVVFNTYWPQTWADFSDVWIIGGDGTLNYFINQYPNIRLPLSIFKGGSGNDFHWMLYGEIDLKTQVEKALNGTVQWIDAGRCNEQLFLNGVGIGFDGAVVQDLLGMKKYSGKVSYLFSILKNVVQYREKNYSIAIDGVTKHGSYFMISIANGKRYGGGFQVAPQANATDGLLDVNLVKKIAPLKRLRYLPVIEKGKHLRLPFIDYQKVKSIVIRCEEKVAAHADGEFFCTDVFEIECLPNRFAFMR